MGESDRKSLIDAITDIFDRLDKYIGIVAAIIAALTFASGNRLLSYSFVIIGYVLLALFLWRVATQKSLLKSVVATPALSPEKRAYAYSKRQRIAAWLALVTLTVFSFGWVGVNGWRDWQEFRGPRPAKEGELLVLISQFDNRGTKKIDAAQRIYDELQKGLEKADLSVRLELLPPIKSEDEARKIGESCNAVFVIWGWYDDVGLDPWFTIIREAKWDIKAEMVSMPADPPRDYTLYITRELPAHMTYFSAFAVGQLYFWDERFEEALSAFDVSIDAAQKSAPPENLATAYRYRGDTHLYLDDPHSAILDYDEALQLNPQDGAAYSNRGFAYAFQNQWEQAIADYNRAIELEPQNIDILAHRGVAHYAVGESQKARQDCQEYLKLGTDEKLRNLVETVLKLLEKE